MGDYSKKINLKNPKVKKALMEELNIPSDIYPMMLEVYKQGFIPELKYKNHVKNFPKKFAGYEAFTFVFKDKNKFFFLLGYEFIAPGDVKALKDKYQKLLNGAKKDKEKETYDHVLHFLDNIDTGKLTWKGNTGLFSMTPSPTDATLNILSIKKAAVKDVNHPKNKLMLWLSQLSLKNKQDVRYSFVDESSDSDNVSTDENQSSNTTETATDLDEGAIKAKCIEEKQKASQAIAGFKNKEIKLDTAQIKIDGALKQIGEYALQARQIDTFDAAELAEIIEMEHQIRAAAEKIYSQIEKLNAKFQKSFEQLQKRIETK